MELSTQLNSLPATLRGDRGFGRLLEEVGVDLLWIGEAYGFDAVSALGFHAATTSRLRLGSGVLSLYSRSAALLAQTAAGIDALSDGRFELGLGASGPQVVEGWHGVPFERPLGRAREYVEICRSIWRRERLEHDGIVALPGTASDGTPHPALRIIDHPVRDRIPIWYAALGPASVSFTAEQADGWLPILFLPELAEETFGEALAEGRSRRSADLAVLQIVAGGFVQLGDAEEGRAAARGSLARFVGGMGSRRVNFYKDLVSRYGFADEAEAVQDLYLTGRRAEAAEAVPELLVERTNLFGDRERIAERVAAYRRAGVTMLNVVPIGPGDPLETLAAVKELTAA